jgi:hypothetical protein
VPGSDNDGMAKRSSKKPTDEQAVESVQVDPATGLTPDGKNAAAVTLGRMGGKKGGPARAAKLTKEQRSEAARKAAQARWKKRKG